MPLAVLLAALAAVAAPASLLPGGVAGPAPLAAQEEPEKPAPREAEEAAREQEGQEEEDEDGVKPYDEVITEEAVTDSGLVVTHLVEGDLYYEIPRSGLEAPNLWVTRIAETQHGTGFGGLKTASRVVRWTYRPGDLKVLLRDVSYEAVADSTDPIFRSVRASNFEPVIKAFDVEAFGPDSSLVVNVTDLFTTDVPELSPKELLGASSLDGDRSFLEEVLAFPENVDVRALLTFRNSPEGDDGGFFIEGTNARTISVVMHHSMVSLPDDPMEPRPADDRVGFFEVQTYDYSLDEHRAPERRMITRWRLECPEGESPPCEPREPIVFYVGPATPEEWRPYVAAGIESWREAFREAGFRDAVVAADPPSEAEDPEWHPEDARYSVVRWTPSTTENAYGPHVHDPRTGEILEADIQMFHNIQRLLQDWYFVQVAPLDDRAAQLPLPDSLMGRLIQYVAAHEVGHSLGFPHNMKASSSFPVDSLRSASFTEEHGDEASIMDYGRFNYVAQPGDGARLIPKIGPYDEFAVEWGYRPFEGDAGAERAALDSLARLQDENPWYRFGSYDGVDPSAQTEDLGDDPVEATRLGLRNLRRTSDMLLDAAGREGDSYDDLERIYERMVGQWEREMGHVVTVVGGVYEQRKRYGQEGVVHTPVPRAEQREAMEFLLENAFRPPEFLVDREILRRIEPTGTVDRISGAQTSLLRRLVSDDRLNRLVEQSAVGPEDGEPYRPAEMLGDLREGIWSELRGGGGVEVGPYRRALQRAWVDLLAEKLDASSDLSALARGELNDVADRIEDRISDADDRVTRLHLRDVQRRIERALDPDA
jgi:hypothetical protein